MDTVRGNKSNLIKWLRGDELILQHVDSHEIITPTEYERLKSIKSPDTRNIELIDMILRKGKNTCCDFLKMLKMEDVKEELHPDLKAWIATVDTSGSSETSVVPGARAPSAANNPNNSPAGNLRIADNEIFLRKKRSELINKVKNVVGIVDDLQLSGEMASLVCVEPTDQAKMRKVLEFTNSKKAAEILITALWKHASDVMDELTSEA